MLSRAACCHRVLGALLSVLVIGAALAPATASAKSGPTAHPALLQDGDARMRYVATDGSDDGDGTAESPWQTIQRAAAEVQPGDTVLIAPGEYEGGITVDTSGTEDQPITFRGAGPGVEIVGSGDERDAFFVTYADWVVIEGLTIREATRAGLRIDASNHVTVRDSVFADNTTWGIFTDFSDDLLIEGNDVSGSREEHGIYVSNSGDRPVVRNNRVYNNVASGIQLNADVTIEEGPNPDGIISGAVIEDNVVYLNGEEGGAALNLDGVVDSVIRNNLLFENAASGITLFQQNGAVCSRDNLVLNNTIVMAEESRWAILISNAYADPGPPTPCAGNRLFNNIIHADDPDRGSISIPTPDLDGFASDYNILVDRFSVDDEETIISLDEWQALGFDANSLLASPDELFEDAEGGEFRLRPDSPAIDAGVELAEAVSVDLEGIERPAGNGIDIGAFEFDGTVVPSPDADEAPVEATEAPVTMAGAEQAPADEETPRPAAGVAPVGVELTEVDGSGVTGLAVLTAADGRTEFTILLRSAAPGQVALVHRGACDGLDLTPAFLLIDPDETGWSESLLDVEVDEFVGGGYAIAIHAGAQDLATVVACGEIAPAGGAGGSDVTVDEASVTEAPAIPVAPPTVPVAPEPTGTITFADQEGRIYQIEAAEGAVPVDLSARLDELAPGTDDWLTVSVDGEWLLLDTTRFDLDCAGWPCLAILPADLSTAEVVRVGGEVVHPEGSGAIAAGGDLIVYEAPGGPHVMDLWALSRAVSGWDGPVLLTADSPFEWHGWPALAPDGLRAVFTCTPDIAAPDETALCEVGVDGDDFRVVLRSDDAPAGRTPGWLHHPSYAPDGAIVFEADWDGEQIWRLPGGATAPELITEEFGNDNSPCVLPDGRIVSLWLDRPDGGGVHEIKVMDPDGSDWFILLPNIDAFDGSHACSA